MNYSVLQKGRIQILKKEQENRERATGKRFDAVFYENENRYKSCFYETTGKVSTAKIKKYIEDPHHW